MMCYEDVLAKEVEYKGFEIKVFYDDMIDNPIEGNGDIIEPLGELVWDKDIDQNLSDDVYTNVMLYFASNYWSEEPEDDSKEEIERVVKIGEEIVRKHNIHYITCGFRDYGSNGQRIFEDDDELDALYYVDNERLKHWGAEGFGDKRIEQWLKDDIKMYNDWLQGYVYRYVIYGLNGEDFDACGGYIGEDADDYAIKEAKDIIDGYLKRKQKEKQSMVKQLIKNHVPLQYRAEKIKQFDYLKRI